MLYFRCKNLALNIRDTQSLVGVVAQWLDRRFETLAIPFTSLCQYLLEEIPKAVGPFYLVSMPGEVKDPTQGVNVQLVVDSTF